MTRSFILALLLCATAQGQFMPVGFWRATATAYDPLTIDSLYVWYSSDVLGVAKNAGDTTYIWRDRSANGRDLYQTSASAKPIYRTDSLNGKPCVVFDGSDDAMKCVFGVNVAQPNTYFVVFKQHKATGSNSVIIDGAGAHRNLIYIASSTYGLYAGTYPNSSNYASRADSARLLTAVFNGAQTVLRVNGKKYVVGDAGTDTMDGILVSQSLSGGGNYPFTIYEIIMSSALLTDAEISAVEQYLLTKYNLPAY